MSQADNGRPIQCRAKGRANRYAQLSDERKNEFAARSAEISVHAALNSFTGPKEQLPYFLKSLAKVKSSCASLQCGQALIEGYVAYCNNPVRKSNRKFECAQSQLVNGFISFLEERELKNISIDKVDTGIVNDFILWLKSLNKKGKVISKNTARRYYGIFKDVLEEIVDQRKNNNEAVPEIVFLQNPFLEAHRDTNSTNLIDDVTFYSLQKACALEVSAIMEKVRCAWKILDNPKAQIGASRINSGMYQNIDAAMLAYLEHFNIGLKSGTVPNLADIRRNGDTHLANAIQYKYGFESVRIGLYPTSVDIFPFVLLLNIYTIANTGPIRLLETGNIFSKVALGNERIGLTFIKGRGVPYTRTFAVDENAQFSPGEIIKFLKKWTERIRIAAGPFSKYLFIFASGFGAIRPFNTARTAASDTDSSWKNASKKFFKKHNLPPIQIKEIRFTGADILREAENDDARAVQAALGNRSKSVNELFYDSNAAKRRRDEKLAHGQNSFQRWAGTAGRIDSRTGIESLSYLSATPGFECFDPYDSPVPGEIFGRQCQAYGRCPNCPLAMVKHSSAYSLARLVQLRSEMASAQVYLDAARWNAVYRENRSKLDFWILEFADPVVIAEAEKMELGPLPALE